MNEREQLRPENVALAHVDDPVAGLGVEAERSAPLPSQRGPAAAVRRRDVRWQDVGCRHPLSRQRREDPVTKEAGIGLVVDMLELAAAAFGEVAAGRLLPVRARLDTALGKNNVSRSDERVELPALPYSIASAGEAEDPVACH
jgi:hypothetical protein